MTHYLHYIGYFAVGLIEWALAMTRTLATIRGQAVLASSIVFTENLVALLVLSQFIRSNDWAIAVVYSLGAALGSLLPMRRMQGGCQQEKSGD